MLNNIKTLLITLFISLLLLSVSFVNASTKDNNSLLAKKGPTQLNNIGVRAPETKRNYKCIVCVAALLDVKQNLEHGSQNIAQLLGAACDKLPTDMQGICQDFVVDFGGDLIKYLVKKLPVDEICSTVHLCDKCSISSDRDTEFKGRMVSSIFTAQFKHFLSPELHNAAQGSSPEAPKIDLDGDGFSSAHLNHRGADWRGRDCNDLSANVHPGVYDSAAGPLVDHNCNGIYGVDKNGKSYEEQYCNGTDVRSFVAFGDSVGAAFEVPAQWILFNNLSSIASAITDELDWPGMASSSGWDPKVKGQSLYGRLRENNLCNHRDYQNLAKNGAQMIDLAQTQVHAWDAPDKPSFIYIGYVGNDVCKDSLDEMTKPEDFKQQFIDGLNALSKKVKAHSYVTAFGLVDGRILWNSMAHKTHPLGVSYSDFYQFLSCTGANPCQTWLTPDEATRNATSARAAELSKIMADVAANHHFDNLSVFYIDFVEILEEALKELEKEGLPPSILISQFDGFHPSLFPGHRVLANKMWDKVKTYHPEFIGNRNPNNDVIKQIFGDQGGY
eukprot:gb/GECH01003175.1/.p1 GENE.gb/GECH01003175.1/~~gb/GECH01003175.1/.p1  ORF type:complete len:556 (+),score=145.26 gb/GECH01003175.1/:1-1668(+)